MSGLLEVLLQATKLPKQLHTGCTGDEDDDDMLVYTPIIRSKKEEKGGEKRNDEENQEIFGLGKLPDVYL